MSPGKEVSSGSGTECGNAGPFGAICRCEKESAIDAPPQGNLSECRQRVRCDREGANLTRRLSWVRQRRVGPNRTSQKAAPPVKINHAPCPIHVSPYPGIEEPLHLHFQAHTEDAVRRHPGNVRNLAQGSTHKRPLSGHRDLCYTLSMRGCSCQGKSWLEMWPHRDIPWLEFDTGISCCERILEERDRP